MNQEPPKLIIPEGPVREALRWLRYLPERAAHPVRRIRAVRIAAALPAPVRVLVLCYGNICRSPYGAEVLRDAAERDSSLAVEVDSAGFVGPDRPSPAAAQSVASRRGRSLQHHRSKLVSPEILERADLIVVMDAGQRIRLDRQYGRTRGVVLLGDFDPLPIPRRTIHDPYDQDEGTFERVYERVERCVGVLAAALSRPREATSSPPAARTSAAPRTQL